MTELHAVGIATVFTTDTHFKVGFGDTAAFGSGLDQLTDTILVDGLETDRRAGSSGRDTSAESADIVAAETKAHLGEVVGTG